MNNYNYASDYILGQVKRLNLYNYKYDDNLYNLILRDPDYIIKTLLYTVNGYFGAQLKYESIMCMIDAPRFFPNNIYIPIRQEISNNYMYIVDDEFYNIFCNNITNVLHPGIDDIDNMLRNMNYDKIYDIYDQSVIENTAFILGFLHSIHYDLLQKYTIKFVIDEDILQSYAIDDLKFEISNAFNNDRISSAIGHIEFSSILIDIVTDNANINVIKSIEDNTFHHLDAIYRKYFNMSFYDEPYKNVISNKIMQLVMELIYDLFECVVEYLIIYPNMQEIPKEYFMEHKLNVGKAIRVLSLPLTETGVYHVM